MTRQVFLAKAVLAVFSFCSIWLPISHSCHEPLSSQAGSAVSGVTDSRTASRGESTHDLLSNVPLHTLPGAPGPCLACLWSHHLFLGKVVVGLGIPRFLPDSEALSTRSPNPVVTIAFEAALKRGPPSSDLA